MSSLVHADIFFFVTTIAVVVVGIAFTVALIYLIAVLGNIKKLTEQVNEEAALVRRDIDRLRTAAERGGNRFRSVSAFLHSLFDKKRGRSRSKSEGE